MLIALSLDELKSLVGYISFVCDERSVDSTDCKLAIKLIKEILQADKTLESTRYYLDMLNVRMSDYENLLLEEQQN
jgi:hypothetical protein